MKRVAVIMAGGSGERFWPLSRHQRPKQLLRIAGEQTLLDAAVERVSSFIDPEDTFVLTSEVLKPAIVEECELLPIANVIAEPEGRNTAACLALATACLEARYGQAKDVSVLVLTADHLIEDSEAFEIDCRLALEFAEQNNALVTFGVQPTRPETGYGYIELGALTNAEQVYRVKSFREKPPLAQAREFVDGGNFLWNCGMFAWRNSVLRESFQTHLPEAHEELHALRNAFGPECEGEIEEPFLRLPKISIDYGILEKADNVYVVRAAFDWDDIGAWSSMYRLLDADSSGNPTLGNAVALNCSNTLVYSPDPAHPGDKPHLVVAYGLEGIVVIHTADATLVVPEKHAQSVKEIVAFLREKGYGEYV